MDIDLEPRPLAGTDLTVSRVVFGAMTFGGQVDVDEATRIVHRCRDAGVTMFDTSNNYTDGRSEEILGAVVRPFRDEVQIATKVGNQHRDDPARRGLGKDTIHRCVDESLARLGVDHIDLYYLHMPDLGTPIEASLEALDELVRAGKVRHIAQSNYAAWQVVEMNWLAERHGWSPMIVSQPIYNLLARRVEQEYAACSERLGLANIVYNPLAGGLLTGKHRPDDAPEHGTRFTNANYRSRYWNADHFATVDELRTIASDAGLTLIELSLRWLLSRPLVDHVLVGVSSLDQLEANLAAMEGAEPDEDTCARIDAVWERLRGAAAAYHR